MVYPRPRQYQRSPAQVAAASSYSSHWVCPSEHTNECVLVNAQVADGQLLGAQSGNWELCGFCPPGVLHQPTAEDLKRIWDDIGRQVAATFGRALPSPRVERPNVLEHFDDEGRLHRDDGPAVEDSLGRYAAWYSHGQIVKERFLSGRIVEYEGGHKARERSPDGKVVEFTRPAPPRQREFTVLGPEPGSARTWTRRGF